MHYKRQTRKRKNENVQPVVFKIACTIACNSWRVMGLSCWLNAGTTLPHAVHVLRPPWTEPPELSRIARTCYDHQHAHVLSTSAAWGESHFPHIPVRCTCGRARGCLRVPEIERGILQPSQSHVVCRGLAMKAVNVHHLSVFGVMGWLNTF